MAPQRPRPTTADRALLLAVVVTTLVLLAVLVVELTLAAQ